MLLPLALLFTNAVGAIAGVINPISSDVPVPSLAITVANSKGAIVESLDDLVLISEVTNVGDAPIHVVKYGGILDGGYTQSFNVKKNGESVAFVGVLAQLSITHADDAMYAVIAPGETITTEHNVAPLYDFDSVGTGEFIFEPIVVIRGMGDLVIGNGFTAPNSFAFTITKDVSERPLDAGHDKRATVPPLSCLLGSEKFVTDTYAESRVLAAQAAAYIQREPGSSLFTAYFKTNSADIIRKRLEDVDNENVNTRTLNCIDVLGECVRKPTTIAYTVIRTSNIHYCPPFFREVTTDRLCRDTTVDARNIRGGTQLHEMIHANSVAGKVPANYIIDVGYGCPQNQARTAFDQARNADNYNCFATAVYKQLNCP